MSASQPSSSHQPRCMCEFYLLSKYFTKKKLYSLQSQHHNLALRITHVVCVNFIHDWHDLQFKINSERQIRTSERKLQKKNLLSSVLYKKI